MVRSVSKYGSVKVKYLAKRDLNPNFVGGKEVMVSDRRVVDDMSDPDGEERVTDDGGGDRRGGGARWRPTVAVAVEDRRDPARQVVEV